MNVLDKLFFGLCRFWIWTDPEHRESNMTTLSTGVEISGLEGHWGVNYSAEACGHCVKVCLVVLLLKKELDSLPECLRW
jgi:hypothetical protein